jgi:sensor histidine kinase regulating citrate/malate metabolism
VKNEGCIPRELQLLIFQRSFSTKGPGRGVGTYSMRLLGETYLGGIVSFATSLDDGTVFRIRLPASAIITSSVAVEKAA